MQPEHDEVSRWLQKAQRDWNAARKLFDLDCEEADVVAFHCQQAVEKLLKAFLVYHAVQFEKAHDLGRLLDHCATVDDSFESIRDTVEPLTLYAVAFRHPGPADPTLEEARVALAVVERAWAFVAAHLPAELVP
jgi:HEPN domain-containing protein